MTRTDRRSGHRPTRPVTSRERRGFGLTLRVRQTQTLPYDPATNYVNLTSYVFEAEIRRYAEDDTVLATLGVNYNDANVGVIYLGLTEAQTTAMPIGDWFWDLKVIAPGAEADQWIDTGQWIHLPVVTD